MCKIFEIYYKNTNLLLVGSYKGYFNYGVINLVKYFSILTAAFHDTPALFGFFIILVVFSQLISGTMLSFSLVPEAMMVPLVRDEEDLEDLYIDDFF